MDYPLKKIILITGGSGFIGTNLLDYYVSCGHRVVNLDIQKPRNIDHYKFWIEVDILNKSELDQVISEINPNIIFHLAARTDLDGKNPRDYLVNTKGVKNIVSSINMAKNIDYVVFASSMLVCKLGYKPKHSDDYCADTEYGRSKVQGEIIIKNACLKVPWTIVRPTSIWGPWFDIPYKNFFEVIEKGLYIHPSGVKVYRSYGFVLNTVHQLQNIVLQTSNTLLNKTIYLADYEPVELFDWSMEIRNAIGRSGRIKRVPVFIFKILALLGDLLKIFGWKNPPMTSFRLNNMLTQSHLNTDMLSSYCPSLPYDMKKGVQITCEWMKKNIKKKD